MLTLTADGKFEITVNSRKYIIRKLNMSDLGELEAAAKAEIKKQRIEMFKELGGSAVDAKTVRELSAVSEQEINDYFESIEGLMFMLWRAMKDDNNIAIDDVKKLFSLEQIQEIIKGLMPDLSTIDIKKNAAVVLPTSPPT